MRKLLLLTGATLISISGFAQRVNNLTEQTLSTILTTTRAGSAGKPTAIGDTQKLTHIPDTASLVAYKLGSGSDSGYINGINYYNDKSFAERYNFNGDDSSMQIIGFYAQFTGKFNTTSTKTVTFNLWDEGDKQIVAADMAYNGFPNRVVNSLTVPITQLGIALVPTPKKYLFANPSMRWGNFFMGYSIDYDYSALNGDTIAIAGSRNGQRQGSMYSLSINISDFGDTSVMRVYNVQNATQTSDNRWIDNYTQNDSLLHNLAIYPIVVIKAPTSVKGISKNKLTLFGAFPNPAANTTSIKYELANTADVTLQIMDMSDRVVNTTTVNNQKSGTHSLQVAVTDLPNGTYIYLLRTSAGDGLAGKMIVNN